MWKVTFTFSGGGQSVHVLKAHWSVIRSEFDQLFTDAIAMADFFGQTIVNVDIEITEEE